MNYLIYPTKTIGITQDYLGTFSHTKYYKGKPQSFPWDEAGKDGGRDYMYCPCDEVEIKRLYLTGTNTIWLQSTTKVQTPTFNDYITLKITHPNDDDMLKLKVGQKFKRGQAIVREGTSGQATGNHFHFEIAKGQFKDLANKGWVKNSLDAWVIPNSVKPEHAFFITDQIIRNTQSIKFIKLIGEPKKDTTKKQVEVLIYNLRLRKEPNGEVLGYVKSGFYNILEIKDNWIKLDIGYIGIGDWLKVHEIVKPIEPINEETKILENKIQELLVENDKLNLKIKQLENNNFSFIAPKDGYYRIKLYKNENLIIK